MVEALWNSFLSDLNAARASMGLAPLTRTLDQLRYAKRHLLAVSPAFDFPSTHVPENVRYIGPLLQEPDWALPADLPDLGDRPFVLVAFSTSFQGQDKVLQAIIEATRDLPVHAVITLGKAMEGWPLRGHSNVTILGAACHDALLERAAATVTHGGHGTTMRSLRHGVPLLVLPMGRDQNDNAARVEYHGAGVQLAATAAPAEIAQAIRRLMTEPRFALNAGRMAAALAAEGDAKSHLVAEIEAVASVTSEAAPCAA
jgi:UDP:flavonoid glycosyltransferase YjiC (YdhE family)